MKFLTNSGTTISSASTTSEVPRPSVMARLGNGFDGRGFGDDFLDCAHDQTRFTMGRPNRPAGLTTSTAMISASAIGSFSSLPTPGM